MCNSSTPYSTDVPFGSFSSACLAPVSISFPATGKDSAVVMWNPVGSASDWVLFYGTSKTDVQNDAVNYMNAPSSTLTPGVFADTVSQDSTALYGLTANTTYYLYLITDCGAGSVSDTSQLGTFTTLKNCDKPSGITFSNVTENTADVSWTAGGTESTWILFYGTNSTDVSADVVNYKSNPSTYSNTPGVFVDTVTTSPNASLNTLSKNTTYFVSLIAECGTTNFSDSLNGTFTTLAGCNAPTNIQVSNITFSTGNVTWDASTGNTEWIIIYGPQGFDISGYLANPGGSTFSSVVADTVSTTSYQLMNLDKDTSYDLYVIGVCGSSNYSSVSGVVNFQTKISSLDKETFTNFNFFPNPVNQSLNLVANKMIDKVTIINIVGKTVLYDAPLSANSSINTSNLKAGVYIMKIKIDGKTKSFKLIKQ